MIRNYTEEELYLKETSSRKFWQQYKAERELNRLEMRHKIAAAIVAAELLQEIPN